jgi:signal transduction histidine kinase
MPKAVNRRGDECDLLCEHVRSSGSNRRIQAASLPATEFLAHASHDLRAPLNAIIGFAELMSKGKVGPVSADHKEYLGDILDSSRQLLRLISDLLDIARLESGHMEFRVESVDLARIVAEVRDGLRELAASKRIQVDTELHGAVAAVTLDPSKLAQLLCNYLSNALKFTPEGGHVTIRVRPETAERFCVEVEDTGIGIRREDIPRVFVEFQRLDAGMTRKYPGSGLGLALARRLARAQGGDVGVRSELGRGSTFWAVLPRRDPGRPSK